jgi:hypothetical protein
MNDGGTPTACTLMCEADASTSGGTEFNNMGTCLQTHCSGPTDAGGGG